MASGAVFAQMTGAGAVAAAKFTAAALGGSAGMLAEGVHSAVNCANGGLMALGQARSKRPPDVLHPFGYGMELYFWTLVVSLVLFAVAGCVTVVKGVYKVIEPGELGSPWLSYAVLAVSAAMGLRSWWAALREFRSGQGRRPAYEAVKKAKDPTTLTALFEGTAGLAGLLIASLGLLLSQALDEPRIDGAASVLIGLLMASVSAFLVYQCRQLLLGESATKEAIKAVAARERAVGSVGEVLTMHLAPDDVLVILKVTFRPGLDGNAVAQAAGWLAATVTAAHPEARRVFVHPEAG